jgi:hypothetical protein
MRMKYFSRNFRYEFQTRQEDGSATRMIAWSIGDLAMNVGGQQGFGGGGEGGTETAVFFAAV